MDKIIEKAVEGGYKNEDFVLEAVVCDSKFWEALDKACNWGSHMLSNWLQVALSFHRVNLTEGWDKAVSMLEAEVMTHPG